MSEPTPTNRAMKVHVFSWTVEQVSGRCSCGVLWSANAWAAYCDHLVAQAVEVASAIRVAERRYCGWCLDGTCPGCVHSIDASEPTPTTALLLRWLSDAIDGSYRDNVDPETVLWRRVTKVTKEAGEAVAALGGYVGENPRKGMTHTRDDLVDELLDVALAALGAVEHVMGGGGPHALALLDTHVQAVTARLSAATNRPLPTTEESSDA